MVPSKFYSVGAFFCGMFVMALAGNTMLDKASAEGNAVERIFVNESSMGFHNVAGVNVGGVMTLFVSGQVGYGENGIPETIEEQADLAFKNVVKQLTDAGAKVEDVVKINTYIKNMDGPRAQAVGAAKAKYFTQEKQPASTWVGVTSLVFPDLLVEVECIAVVDMS